jgi:hypothetical protein
MNEVPKQAHAFFNQINFRTEGQEIHVTFLLSGDPIGTKIIGPFDSETEEVTIMGFQGYFTVDPRALQ